SIKLKLGIVVVASGATALAFFWWRIGWLPPATAAVAIVLALCTSQVLAHGMTRPLRAMTATAKSIARGQYQGRVRDHRQGRGRRAGHGLQPDGRRPRRRRPAAP
ncbi:LOW QUALITY PROTEIN: two-component system sensor kinase, partial [Kutzneria sp. 744]